jgi:hypothetical protein
MSVVNQRVHDGSNVFYAWNGTTQTSAPNLISVTVDFGQTGCPAGVSPVTPVSPVSPVSPVTPVSPAPACKIYNIQGQVNGASYNYDSCTTGNVVSGTLNSGQSIQVCAETGTVNGSNVIIIDTGASC